MDSGKRSTTITLRRSADGRQPGVAGAGDVRTGPLRVLCRGHTDQQIRKKVPMVATAAPNNQGSAFPSSATPLVGREREVMAVGELLRQPTIRLVTLTGPGGVGKTRLAMRVAEAVGEDFPDGLWFVPLASISDPALVLSVIARALDVRETGHRSLSEGIAHFLHRKDALLILDNFEQVVAAAPLVAELLAR